MTPQYQHFGLPWLQRREHGADLFLLLSRRMNIFRSRHPRSEPEHPFVPVPPRAMAQLVQSLSDRRPIEPSFRSIAVRPGTLPELEEHLDRQFFGPRVVFYYSGDHARHPLILGAKRRLEIERLVRGFHAVHNIAWCVHNTITPPVHIL